MQQKTSLVLFALSTATQLNGKQPEYKITSLKEGRAMMVMVQ